MKRTLSALLVATALLGTAACSDTPPDPENEVDSNTENLQTEIPAPIPS